MLAREKKEISDLKREMIDYLISPEFNNLLNIFNNDYEAMKSFLSSSIYTFPYYKYINNYKINSQLSSQLNKEEKSLELFFFHQLDKSSLNKKNFSKRMSREEISWLDLNHNMVIFLVNFYAIVEEYGKLRDLRKILDKNMYGLSFEAHSEVCSFLDRNI